MSEYTEPTVSFEYDLCRTNGSRPFVPGNIYLGTFDVTNNTSVLFTVPAVKSFWLVNCSVRVLLNTGARSIYITDADDNIIYDLAYIYYSGSGNITNKIFYPKIPMELRTGMKIYGASSGSGIATRYSIYGYYSSSN